MKFPADSRVCFVGDSITHANHFISRIAGYYHLNFPGENINFYNCGISGATTSTTLAVFDIDIAIYRPTHAVVMIGVNDSGREKLTGKRTPELYTHYKHQFEQYKKNLAKICNKLADLGAEITLCTPVPVDEYSEFDTPTLPGAFAMLSAYADHVRKFAWAQGYGLCDYFSYFTEMLWKGEVLYREDRIHPNENGHFYMAKCFLKHQGYELGEYAPMPKFIEEWDQKAEFYRNIINGEYFFIGRYDLPPEESVKIIKEKLDSGTLDEFFTYMAKAYVENKMKQKALHDEVLEIMEKKLKTFEYVNQ